jgi:hypothetical protein
LDLTTKQFTRGGAIDREEVATGSIFQLSALNSQLNDPG